MDKIFSLDLSSSPVAAVVLEKEQGQSKVVDQMEVLLEDREIFQRFFHAPRTFLSNEEVEHPAIHTNESLREDLQQSFHSISDLYTRHLPDLTSVVVVLPSTGFLGFTASLPFNDPRLIKKVIKIEIQDQLPFELEQFVLSYQVLDQNADNSYNVFTSLLPRAGLEKTLSFLKSINIEADYLTVPAAVLAGEHQSEKPELLLRVGEQHLELSVVTNNRVKSVHSLSYSSMQSFPETELKMFMLNFTNLYQARIESVSILGNHLPAQQLQQMIELPVQSIDPDENSSDQQLIAVQAAKTVSEHPEFLISNFLSGEFASNKILKLIVSGLLKLKYYLLGLVIVLLLVPIAAFWWNQQEISALKYAIRENITQRIPWISFPEGRELETLMASSGQVEAQLESLGSPAKAEPLEVYLILTEMLAEANGPKIEMDLQEIEINGNQVLLDGTVPNYKGVDRLEKLIKKRKDIFCSVKTETPGGGLNKRFQFKLKLC